MTMHLPAVMPGADALTTLVETLVRAELATRPEPLLTTELRALVVEVVTRTVLHLELGVVPQPAGGMWRALSHLEGGAVLQ